VLDEKVEEADLVLLELGELRDNLVRHEVAA
jgi:hypothetical protein